MGMKPLFEQVSSDVVELIAQSQPREFSQISVVVDEKHRVVKIAFLGQSVQEHSGWIGVSPFGHCDI